MKSWAEQLDGAKDGKEFGDILLAMCAKVEEQVSGVDDDE